MAGKIIKPHPAHRPARPVRQAIKRAIIQVRLKELVTQEMPYKQAIMQIMEERGISRRTVFSALACLHGPPRKGQIRQIRSKS
jgi:hypothetical protein